MPKLYRVSLYVPNAGTFYRTTSDEGVAVDLMRSAQLVLPKEYRVRCSVEWEEPTEKPSRRPKG